MQVGFNGDGYIQALDVTMYANDGYTSEFGWAVSIFSCCIMKNGCNILQRCIDSSKSETCLSQI